MKKYSFTRIKIKEPKAYFKNNKSRGLKKNVLSINKKVILILLLILYLIFIIYKKIFHHNHHYRHYYHKQNHK